jgi:hypothetical protein
MAGRNSKLKFGSFRLRNRSGVGLGGNSKLKTENSKLKTKNSKLKTENSKLQ